jgi:hypothetical protein
MRTFSKVPWKRWLFRIGSSGGGKFKDQVRYDNAIVLVQDEPKGPIQPEALTLRFSSELKTHDPSWSEIGTTRILRYVLVPSRAGFIFSMPLALLFPS